MSWPVAWMLNARRSPWNVPVGRLTFASWMAPDTSSMPMPPAGQQVRIDLHADRPLLLAEDDHLGDALHHRQPLGEDRLGVLVHLVQRQRVRPQGEDQDGEVGRVHLAERRRGRHVGRQRPRRLRDRRLHVERGRVDVAVEGELAG